mgnify:CR=1 FL=1
MQAFSDTGLSQCRNIAGAVFGLFLLFRLFRRFFCHAVLFRLLGGKFIAQLFGFPFPPQRFFLFPALRIGQAFKPLLLRNGRLAGAVELAGQTMFNTLDPSDGPPRGLTGIS